MNLDKARVVLRPRTLAEVCDLACRLCFSTALPLYLRLAAIFLLPLLALTLLFQHGFEWEPAALWFFVVTVGTIVQGVFTAAAGRIIFAETVSVGEAARAFFGRFRAYLGALLLSRVLLALAAVFFVLPAVFVWVRMLYVHEACLLEAANSAEATRRSSRFVLGYGSNAFQVLMALVIAQVSLIIAAELLGHGIVDGVLQLGKPFGALLESGISPYALFGYLVSIPFVATARFLTYIDTRTRTDGWDIQLKFIAIAAHDGERLRVGA